MCKRGNRHIRTQDVRNFASRWSKEGHLVFVEIEGPEGERATHTPTTLALAGDFPPGTTVHAYEVLLDRNPPDNGAHLEALEQYLRGESSLTFLNALTEEERRYFMNSSACLKGTIA